MRPLGHLLVGTTLFAIAGCGVGAQPGAAAAPLVPKAAPTCSEADRQCPHVFRYSGNGQEAAVTLVGDFAPTGWSVGTALTAAGNVWSVSVSLPWNGQVIYKLKVQQRDGSVQYVTDPANPNTVDDGFGGKNSVLAAGTCSDFSCAGDVAVCPGAVQGSFDWRDAVMYFVFVDRFLDGNPGNDAPLRAPGLDPAVDWQGGDWAGVTSKIKEGYFRSLGVNTLWLTVPVDSSDSTGLGTDGKLYSGYHGYWPRDLGAVERRFGTEADLHTLVDTAHQAGLKVLMDYTMHHVHTDSPVWQQHQNDGWFHPLYQNGQKCVCGTGTCSWDGPTGQSCWFIDYLPAFDFTNPAARDFSVGNAVDWITRFGFDGLRLDAVKQIDPSWLTELRSEVTQKVEPTTHQHVYLVGETFSNDSELVKSFVNPCSELDGQFDFPLRAALDQAVLMRQGSLRDLRTFMDADERFYAPGVMSTFLGNHDVPRSIHLAEDTPLWNDVWTDGKDRNWQNQPGLVPGTSAYERMALGFAVLFTNRGIPLIYYGDEVGLPGAGDPDNRRMMQWSGYSAGQLLLEAQIEKLGALRAAHPALRRGTRSTLSIDDDTWAYQMTDGTDQVWVLLNRSDVAKSVGGLPNGSFSDAISGETVDGPTITVPARGFRALTKSAKELP